MPPFPYRRIVLICLMGLAALGLVLMVEAMRLQAEQDRQRALGTALSALRPVLHSANPGEAARRLQALLQREDLGFRFLALEDAQGRILASTGSYEALALPLSAVQRERLRRWLYVLTSEHGRAVLTTAQGNRLGALEYAVRDPLLQRVRDEALARLWWFGAAAALLAAPLLVALPRSWRRWDRRTIVPRDPPEPAPAVGQAHEARAAAALGALGRAVLLVDAAGRVRYLNKAAEALTGWSERDAAGQLVYSVFHAYDDADEPVLSPAELVLREAAHVAPAELRLRARDGREIPVEAMAVRLRDEEGQLEGAVMFFHDISDRRAAAAELQRSTRLAQGVINHLVEGVITTDAAGHVRFANTRVQRMFGYTGEELEGMHINRLLPVPFLNSPQVRLTDYIASRRSPQLPRVVGWRKDATTFPVELLVETMREEGGRESLVVIVRDITERLRRENLTLRLGRLLDNAAEEIYIFDAQSLHFLEVNRGAQRNLGYAPEELARMTPLSIAVDLDSDRFQAYLARLRGGAEDHLVYRCKHRRADGSTYPVEVRLSLSREEEPPVFMAIASDISERQAREERLQFLAHHDPLTGLPNRATLVDRLRQALLQSARSGRTVAVLFLDMDRFKEVNDMHGHETGDEVLRIAAERIRSALRASDTVARFGGDEFVVVAGGLHDARDAEALAEKLLERFQPPFQVQRHALDIGVTIGLAVHPGDAGDPDVLLQHADAAMYAAKQAGRRQYRRYQPSATNASPAQPSTPAQDLPAALALSQLRLALHPVLEAPSGDARALAAEVRWEHPRLGGVSAEQTQAAARTAGHASELEFWLLQAACRLLSEQAPGLPIIVPFSAWQLRQPPLQRRLRDLVEGCSPPAGALVLALHGEREEDLRRALGEAQVLREAGIRLGVIHGGGGFAALNRLAALGVEVLVLPSEDVALLPRNPELRQRVQSLLATATALPLQVLALGVEREEARKALLRAGCVLAAGAAVHPALKPADLDAFLAGRRRQALWT